jgi:hypothetical protein
VTTTKKKRKTKVSKGIHGAKRHHLSILEKALMGKGMIQAIKPFRATTKKDA